MKYLLFACPNCKQPLTRKDGSLVCENKHCFDIAKEGYINLVRANYNSNAGDNDEMLKARDLFLSGEHYDNLAKKLANIILKYNKCSEILDAGCGTGYYISKIKKDIKCENIYGVDIAKKAVKIASKKNTDCSFAVASVFEMPFQDKTFSTILNVFSPFAFEEYERVLKDDGILLSVYPGPNHLIELKKAIYKEDTILNDKNVSSDLFKCKEKINVSGIMTLNNEEILALIKMTPYFYTTPKEKLDSLNSIQELAIQYDFIIDVLIKD